MCNGPPPAAPRRSWALLVYIGFRGSRRTRLLAAGCRRAIVRPRSVGVDDRCCGAGRADGLASVLSKGCEPESRRGWPSGGAASGTVLFPALLGPSQLLLFGPWTVHETNRTEFLVGFWELAPGWVWLIGPVVGVLATLGIVMPARWFPRYVAALCAVGVLLWTQGNLLLADYGLLDGGGLDLASHAWRTPFEAGLWVCVFLLAVIFANMVARVAPVACVALVTLQATVLVVPVGRMATADVPSTAAAETAWQLPPPEIYELSGTRNLIHIVLDTFPSRTFVDILDADRPAFDRDWPGFTFFANHLGAHRTTAFSMPAMLSGVAFRNEMPFNEFLTRHPSIFHVLGQRGYRLRSLTSYRNVHPSPTFPGAEAAVRYDIPTPYGSYRDHVDVAAAQLLDLSLFRHAPHAFKPHIYHDGRWFFQQRIASQRGPEATAGRPFGDVAFLREFANRVTPGRRRTRLHAPAPDDAAHPGRDGRGLRVRAQAGRPGKLRRTRHDAPCQRFGRCSSDCETSTSTTEAPSSSPPTMDRDWLASHPKISTHCAD